jgi:antitoxin component YwqK of YwqJK toxin-antitoxin module
MISTGVTYYSSGKVEWICPLTQDQDGRIHDDGVWKSFYEDGRMEREEGRRAGGDGLVQHGVKRSYSEKGTITEEEFYIDGRKVTPNDWKHWLETHAEDAKYSATT